MPAIDKIYPATGETIAKIEPATAEMLDDAVACAAAAQRSWAAYEPLAWAHVSHEAAALMREANAEIAQL
jgi:betaine-aldehyde dehydrogenase